MKLTQPLHSKRDIGEDRGMGQQSRLEMRPYEAADYERVLEVCIAAFEPIHQGFEAALGQRIFNLQYDDWKERYAATIRTIAPDDEKIKVYVAAIEGNVAGFIFLLVDAKRQTGEIGLNAVDPPLQGLGIGKAMYEFALAKLKEHGALIACVGTGGDDAHERARRAYAAVGFDRGIPGVYLFKSL
jgi:GNAT superfamily N-acetyltransferase